MQSPAITICSVFYSEPSKKFLQLNVDLVRRLNPGQSWHWIAADNTPTGPDTTFSYPGLEIIQGLHVNPAMIGGGNYHHAEAIHASLPYVQTRFVLILDMDFYLLQPDWIKKITMYMGQHNLAFFGSVWHPKYYRKIRYFPSPHCMFIDLDKVKKDELNFLPRYKQLDKKIDGGSAQKNVSLKSQILRSVGLMPFFRDRLRIGMSRDTGYNVFRRYGYDQRFFSERVIPVFRPHDTEAPAYALSWWNRVFESVLPDRLCFLPKRKGYYSEVRFRDRGYFDAYEQGWEEYWWQDQPFGIHLRGVARRLEGNSPIVLELVKSGLATFK